MSYKFLKSKWEQELQALRQLVKRQGWGIITDIKVDEPTPESVARGEITASITIRPVQTIQSINIIFDGNTGKITPGDSTLKK